MRVNRLSLPHHRLRLRLRLPQLLLRLLVNRLQLLLLWQPQPKEVQDVLNAKDKDRLKLPPLLNKPLLKPLLNPRLLVVQTVVLNVRTVKHNKLLKLLRLPQLKQLLPKLQQKPKQLQIPQ